MDAALEQEILVAQEAMGLRAGATAAGAGGVEAAVEGNEGRWRGETGTDASAQGVHVARLQAARCPCVYVGVCISVYLSICLSIYLFVCLSIYLPFYLSIYLSTYLSISIYLSICLSIDRSIYIYIYIYIHIYLSIHTRGVR